MWRIWEFTKSGGNRVYVVYYLSIDRKCCNDAFFIRIGALILKWLEMPSRCYCSAYSALIDMECLYSTQYQSHWQAGR